MEQINAVQTDSGFENIFADYPDVVGADEIAKMLGISRKQVYKILREGRLPEIGRAHV